MKVQMLSKSEKRYVGITSLIVLGLIYLDLILHGFKNIMTLEFLGLGILIYLLFAETELRGMDSPKTNKEKKR